MKTENLQALKINKLSQKQFEREAAAGNLSVTEWYLTPEEELPTKLSQLRNDVGFITLRDMVIPWDTLVVFDGGDADVQIAVLDKTILL